MELVFQLHSGNMELVFHLLGIAVLMGWNDLTLSLQVTCGSIASFHASRSYIAALLSWERTVSMA